MLIVNKAYLPETGGVETIVHQIAKIQMESGDECKALTYSRNEKAKEYIYEGVKIHCMGTVIGKKFVRVSLGLKGNLKKLIKNKDIVLFNYPTFQVGFVNKKYKKLYKLVFYHGDITRWGLVGEMYQKVIGEKFLKNAEKIIVSDPRVIQSSKSLIKYKDKCEVLPFGVDTNKFVIKECNIRNKIENDLGVQGKKLVLFVGCLDRYKGIDVLLRSLKQLNDNYRLVIVSNDNIKDKYRGLINALNLQYKFIQYNRVGNDRLVDFYNSCDLLVLPSTNRAETFGIVAIEAMACGLPVVTTEIGTATSYNNIDGVTGRVIKPKNTRELTEAITEICNNSQQYTAEKARKRAVEFSLDKFKDKWTSLIKDINKEIEF